MLAAKTNLSTIVESHSTTMDNILSWVGTPTAAPVAQRRVRSPQAAPQLRRVEPAVMEEGGDLFGGVRR
jgi:hypothetical protein